ncbi:3'-5' exonuclease [Dysgonomonas sp. 25]|uniref:3'-5' exonuclease n=1 Tax=Dysgonomonas sp. 25 TaxID=2302933 RepID=UPI0013D503F2|nr:3'-5' exonuclease [Dysgonomonas sp. 25]NDV68693.1 3'-5' exonuclease domain-containing protein 2 [Dysgonomonas sp. 25]
MVKSISKEELAALPVETFPGRIILIQSHAEAEKAAQYLSGFDKVGFDSETRPTFRKGKLNKIALIQLSTEDTCFLFRTNIIGIPDCLSDILTSDRIMKIGVSVHDDISAINGRRKMRTDDFIDLQKMVKAYGIEDASLQRIYAILFGKRITKGQRLSNWETDVLSDAQKQYAAIDAWACLRIYYELQRIKLGGNK